MVDFRDLVKAGVHFGHQTARWNPRMAPYIWGHRKGIHLIDVSKTAHYLEQAAKFLESVASEGKQILWVGTKKPAQKIIDELAPKLKMPYVNHRWIGGTLTNFPQVKKSVTKLLHFEDVLARSDQFAYTKKELLNFQKIVDRLNDNVGGIRNLKWPIGAIVIVDVKKERTALREAHAAGVPVVALVDTNCDPSMVDYIIPGNDDSPKAISIVINYLGEVVRQGLKKAVDSKEKEVKKEEVAEPTEKEKTGARKAVSKIVSKVVARKSSVKKEEEPKRQKKL